ncbi:hypothetical protein [Streptomyces sp. C]|uniref:hypothetical protein n=1 Tax=Streptomyces sp. C TaxID=253839 RepID=UPI0001B50923|nr:hypothetical protein [Streptomyces sp. C]
MSEITPEAKGPAPVRLEATAGEAVLVPASQVRPEDIGTLAIEYRDGVPVIVVSGGKFIPAGISVVNQEGVAVARVTAAPIDSVLDGGEDLLAGGSLVLGYQGWLAGAQLAYDTTEPK